MVRTVTTKQIRCARSTPAFLEADGAGHVFVETRFAVIQAIGEEFASDRETVKRRHLNQLLPGHSWHAV